jgi:hypothetical protein
LAKRVLKQEGEKKMRKVVNLDRVKAAKAHLEVVRCLEKVVKEAEKVRAKANNLHQEAEEVMVRTQPYQKWGRKVLKPECKVKMLR